MINLQTLLFVNTICNRTRKVIQKQIPNFKLSKMVGPGFMKRQTHAEKMRKKLRNSRVLNTFLETFWVLFLHTENQNYT